MKAVEFKNVSFSYDGSTDKVLDNVNFGIEYGKISLLMGPSGSGKSTIISLILGLIPELVEGKLSGEVLVDGKSINSLSSVCEKVGVVLQNPEAQIIHKYVEDEIAFGMENLGFSPSKITENIEKYTSLLKLNTYQNTLELSGGEKQRLMTAATLAMESKIIILDEPLANLCRESTRILIKTLKDLKAQGYAILIVEHRLDVVKSTVDTILVIDKGKVLTAKKEDLKTKIIELPHEKQLIVKEPLFEVNNLSFKYHKDYIIKNLTFDVFKGEKLLLIGENGAGKTTLLKILGRLIKRFEGTVKQKLNKSLGQKKGSRKWFKTIGYIYQNPNYQLFMPTVKQEIHFKAYSDDYANKIIKLFDLEKLTSKHPQSLSEGQKRLVSIAAVLATKPEVLFLDEPTVGLDTATLERLVYTINSIHEETGCTLITITHDKRCAEAFCDRALIIDRSFNYSVVETKDELKKYFEKDS